MNLTLTDPERIMLPPLSLHHPYRDIRTKGHGLLLRVSLNLGRAQHPHGLRVRCGFSALSVSGHSSPITPGGQVLSSLNVRSCPVITLTAVAFAVPFPPFTFTLLIDAVMLWVCF